MSRSVWLSVSLLLLGVAAFLLSMNGCGGGNTTAVITTMPPASKIQHVVIIFQENRTPDNLFQDPALIANGADIQNYGVNSTGAKIPLSQIDLGTAGSNPDDYDLSHAHSAFVDMCDLNTTTNTCAMDGADLIPIACQKNAANCDRAGFRPCLQQQRLRPVLGDSVGERAREQPVLVQYRHHS
jgi:hypothetical protein